MAKTSEAGRRHFQRIAKGMARLQKETLQRDAGADVAARIAAGFELAQFGAAFGGSVEKPVPVAPVSHRIGKVSSL